MGTRHFVKVGTLWLCLSICILLCKLAGMFLPLCTMTNCLVSFMETSCFVPSTSQIHQHCRHYPAPHLRPLPYHHTQPHHYTTLPHTPSHHHTTTSYNTNTHHITQQNNLKPLSFSDTLLQAQFVLSVLLPFVLTPFCSLFFSSVLFSSDNSGVYFSHPFSSFLMLIKFSSAASFLIQSPLF